MVTIGIVGDACGPRLLGGFVMRISRVQVKNFRNFADLDIELGEHAVFVGENKVGKSNLLHALQLVLDPSLPDTARHLRLEDFWDGLERPLGADDRISISVDLTDFEGNEAQLAQLAEHLIVPDPMTSRLTYVFQPLSSLEGDPASEADYEFLIYGGDRPENRVEYQVRRRLPLEVLPAMRDAEGDLLNQRQSPLRPLLDRAAAQLDRDALEEIAKQIEEATKEVVDIDEITHLVDDLARRLESMAGPEQALKAVLGFSPTDPERLLRSLRLFIDDGARGIADASLGSANLLYLAMRTLNLEQMVEEKTRDHTFLAIEEPEAHVHPHLQRSVFKSFLSPREHQPGQDRESSLENTSIILTTHSPHIASVSPLRSIVVLRKDGDNSVGYSASDIDLEEWEVDDLERYIDTTRGEILFAKGVILVEGDAEEFLVPVLASELDVDLDHLGITVCSVAGTNFRPFVRLLKELGTPYSVLTDLDPREGKEPLGVSRVCKLLEDIVDEHDLPDDEDDRLEMAPEHGLFLNESTLECEVWACGRHKSMCAALIDLAPGDIARVRAEGWLSKPCSVDFEQLMKDITTIAKGRFSQRLAVRIKQRKKRLPKCVPEYIADAINFVVEACGD